MILAGRQKGLVARRQLLVIGIAAKCIDEWVAGGRLHVVHPSVYLVGHTVMPVHARELAAALACGPGAVLSHRSAAELWELLEPRRGFSLQVTVQGRRITGPSGIYAHTSDCLPPDEVDERHGIPVTSAERSVLDLATQAPMAVVARAYEEGLIQKRFDRKRMIELTRKHRGRRGIVKVQALIDRDAPPSVTIREAHWRLLELIRSSGLPHPSTEVPIGPYRVDVFWADARLVVEMDGAAFHRTKSRQERDKLRDAELVAMGYAVIRVTWKELTERPAAVIARIARAHAARLHLYRPRSTDPGRTG